MLHDLAYLDAAFDQPSDEAAAPRMLVLCTTPRCGSHRLGRALFDLGLGVQEEYLHSKVMRILGGRWAVDVDPQSADSPLGLLAASLPMARARRICRAVDFRQSPEHPQAVYPAVGPAGLRPSLSPKRGRPGRQLDRTHAEPRRPIIATIATMSWRTFPASANILPRSIGLVHRYLALQNRKWRRFLADERHLSISSEAFFARPTEVLQAIVAQCGNRGVDGTDRLSRGGRWSIWRLFDQCAGQAANHAGSCGEPCRARRRGRWRLTAPG